MKIHQRYFYQLIILYMKKLNKIFLTHFVISCILNKHFKIQFFFYCRKNESSHIYIIPLPNLQIIKQLKESTVMGIYKKYFIPREFNWLKKSWSINWSIFQKHDRSKIDYFNWSISLVNFIVYIIRVKQIQYNRT